MTRYLAVLLVVIFSYNEVKRNLSITIADIEYRRFVRYLQRELK